MIRIPMNMIIFARKKLLDIFSEGAVSSDASRPPFFLSTKIKDCFTRSFILHITQFCFNSTNSKFTVHINKISINPSKITQIFSMQNQATTGMNLVPMRKNIILFCKNSACFHCFRLHFFRFKLFCMNRAELGRGAMMLISEHPVECRQRAES